ncbi:Putative Midasin [[Torrubiella] hemipterigena]|uniref:Midasin n=1 Tax=[Torrubiella] hemipterigena TaxID=1531966 RepID=A0A0A1T3P7_9HYPO|nr:Putative Midasin [[Torrubiella] hemipterigena]
MADVTQQRRSLLRDAAALHHLPSDLLQTLSQYPSANSLDAVATAALSPPLTERIFVHFELLFPDIVARWVLAANSSDQIIQTASALARILPFAPYLAAFIHSEPSTSNAAPRVDKLSLRIPQPETVLSQNNDETSLTSLVTTWRLLNFDFLLFNSSVSPAQMQALFTHSSRAIRYMAIRIFCMLMRASDFKMEALVDKHLGNEPVMGNLDGKTIDFCFISLAEHQRANIVLDLRAQATESTGDESPSTNTLITLTPYVMAYGKSLLPRPRGPTGEASNLVLTPTTIANLEQLASKLQKQQPILIHGAPGVGKTAVIHEIAKQLGMYESMVTLHLNEQTDAKMLIGLYSTDSKPGSFQWRPGVLTTAVREGRWVLVEDLDRAPTEVLSTLLPLIERNELFIPSRGETVHAASTFRLFATVRTSRGMNGQENLPSLVGMRFWQTMSTVQLTDGELETVVLQSYPILKKFIPGILAVHNRLSAITKSPLGSGRSRSMMDRQITLRDLLKWCRRLQECLFSAGSVTGEEPITETTRDWMFMEAIDCFVGSCPDIDASNQLVYAVAEEMHLSKERADHYIAANIPLLKDTESQIQIGRVSLKKQVVLDRAAKNKRPFASTVHAKRLLEQIAVAVKLSEPVLLVGETGIGKTTVVQQLAESLGNKLVAVNLSQQSEVGDLLGGFKPVNIRALAIPLKEEFDDLFTATGISATKNQKYLEQIGKCLSKSQWSKLSKLWKEAPKMFTKILEELQRRSEKEELDFADDGSQPTKRRKTESKLQTLLELKPRWDLFATNLEQFDIQVSAGPGGFAFSFMEGNLVKAVRHGHWVLLDEINLASADTLESIADLLTGPNERPFLLLSETGEIEKVTAHPNFRIFGAMNPATDIGKRDLPIGIRSRFTEIYVRSPDTDIKDLLTIIKTYLGSTSNKNDQAADDIGRLYLNTKRLAEEKRIVDGANEVPHFSLRTLTRVLTYVNTIAPFYGIRRALYEGFSMGFLTLLERESEKMLMPLIHHHLLDKHGNAQSLLSQPPKHPADGKQYVKFQNNAHDRQYWLFQGEESVVERDDYIITPYVERNLLNLVRATSTRRFPILIQGPTSAGKTSMIEYLANFTGNKFVRINNHEHTDLQEYLGTYVSGMDGKLRFQEGILVQAMRKGHWIVLDELNLAPTDVLEALNRLLDDNRELLIPETQEIVKPHENFILFATQNPPGLYGGRKVLSRAFRNRFLELHFDDIPEDELEYILQQRSRNTSPPDCRRIVSVYKELSRLRQTSRLFEQKDSFATLRDLFRWALREADTREEIACHGFMLLAERVRNDEERDAVKEIIEKVFKVKIDPAELYSAKAAPELKHIMSLNNSQGVVWTQAMRRLYVLVSRALRNNEPVLLVGETGCGKTTVCQLLAEAISKDLHIVNAHQNTETGDLIGSQRPVRNRGNITAALEADLNIALTNARLDVPENLEDKLTAYDTIARDTLDASLHERITANLIRSKALFEWSDGALVEAMRDGSYFLLDEISLADDSVLERLNSVLEPSRTLLLAEKGTDDSFVRASDGFQFFATMNPGGDFGKKELSPALRNRFTEIWVPQLSGDGDIYEIVRTKLTEEAKPLTTIMVDFATWFGRTFRPMATTFFSVREILAWVQFVNASNMGDLQIAMIHGASAIFIDSIGANPSAILASDMSTIQQQRAQCFEKLGQIMEFDALSIFNTQPKLMLNDETFSIGPFSVDRNSAMESSSEFAFHAPTTQLNVMRVVRALQMKKPILLEGSPGVGKTTLVTALAQICGRPLTRINLSDQTDLMDLFGTDVPVEGAEAGNFTWRDAPFLQAMQKGEWVLLDEMNLASQSVLEGLNACLDHRGEVYISELDQVFKRHPDFRLFAAQNPHHQGGGRKGLPASFVNRFIVVYADTFTEEDLLLIAGHNFPSLPSDVVSKLIQFVFAIGHQLMVTKSFGAQGAPWEFNLRDVLRWLHLLSSKDPVFKAAELDDFIDIVIRQRFRAESDRSQVDALFASIFGKAPRQHHLYHDLSSTSCQVGLATLERNLSSQPERLPCLNIVPRLAELETLMICVKQNIPCILTAQSGYGKTALLEHVAAISGRSLAVFPMNADVDTMDLVGGFEQADPLREVNVAVRSAREFLRSSITSVVPSMLPEAVLDLLHQLHSFNGTGDNIERVQSAIATVLESTAANSEAAEKLLHLHHLLSQPLSLEAPRFEWLDGIIIKALEAGQWLVLDNANLCNASVLDRLNSLLEPKGFLSVNEHCGPAGEPRIVYPHPDFRVFLTVDPRYGELSRAMRNRAVEINLCDEPPTLDACLNKISPVESALQRYHSFLQSEQLCDDNVRVNNLSINDLGLLSRFIEFQRETGQKSSKTESLLYFLQSQDGNVSHAAINQLYSGLSESGLTDGFIQTQPLHPLLNFNISRLARDTSSAHHVAVIFEVSESLYRIERQIDHHRAQAKTSKLSALSRLERSLISEKVVAVSKDSTVGVEAFLHLTLNFVRDYLKQSNAADFQEQSHILRLLLTFVERTITLTNANWFDEALFQAHLGQGTAMIQTQAASIHAESGSAFLTQVMGALDAKFTSGFKLSTGLSMEQLWMYFRPVPIEQKHVFDQNLRLDALGVRFDELKWKTDAPIVDLAKAQNMLAQAYRITRVSTTSVDELLDDIEKEIQVLETRIGDAAQEFRPYFAEDFERLRQVSLLQDGQTESAKSQQLSILSNLPARVGMMLESSSNMGRNLEYVAYFGSSDTYVWDGQLLTSTWGRLANLDSVPLKGLALLETELPALGRQVSSTVAEITANHLEKVNDLLHKLIIDVFNAHSPDAALLISQIFDRISEAHLPFSEFDAQVLKDSPALAASIDQLEPVHLQSTLLKYFVPAIAAMLEARRNPVSSALFSGLAWVYATTGFTSLYIPDRILDPQLRPKMEREFLQQVNTSIEDEMNSIRDFEMIFTGQDTNVRLQMLREELDDMGPLPEAVQPIYRPDESQLSHLHAEFTNILKAVLDPKTIPALKATAADALSSDSGLDLLKENVRRLFSRLLSRFEAYQDLTRPAANFLRCFLIGLSLCDAAAASDVQQATSELLRVVPFANGSVAGMLQLSTIDNTFEYLDALSTRIAVEGLKNLAPAACQGLFQCFHTFFEEWNKRLESDKKAEEAKTSLYKFRGSLEDEEEHDAEEFNELFPTYGDEEPMTRSTQLDDVRKASVRVATIHKDIFLTNKTPKQALKAMSEAIVSRATEDVRGKAFVHRDITSYILPTTLSILQEQRDKFEIPISSKQYNFYTDSNLVEARALVLLLRKLKLRFKELQGVDEIGHMQPLIDVIQGADKVLELVHSDPLAKILPKLEQLHAHVYEWQFGGWAPAKYGALELYNSLTDNLIKWRRLELSTWANLFDMEQARCQEDAASWWFIAYQVIIAVPLTLVDAPEDLNNYANAFTRDLEAYFSTSIVGQFRGRIDLLRQLRVHLDMLTKDYPSLTVIGRALSNFIGYFARYEKAAETAIADGRAPIDKKMKDVLLMASWKDTNINALRESAKKSHLKLFRLIRKFRSVLGQHMSIIIARGLPEETHTPLLPATTIFQSPALPKAKPALSLLETHIADWATTHKRLANISTTTSVLQRITHSPELANTASALVDNFVAELESSMTELRKETPPHLTDENTSEVKHLKTRKRKLFADALRDLRNMGLRYNLAQGPLAEQSSLATILTSDGSLSNCNLASTEEADYYFHKTLDLTPKVRDSAREHSEDLSSAEVMRSIGFVEGSIYFARSQRRKIESSVTLFASLEQSIVKFASLSSSTNVGPLANTKEHNNWTAVLPWLVEVLKYLATIIKSHGSLASDNHTDLLEQVQSWTRGFEELAAQLRSLPQLGPMITSHRHLELQATFTAEVASLETALEDWATQKPQLAFILRQVIPWSTVISEPAKPRRMAGKLTRFATDVSILCDKLLVAVENARKKSSDLPKGDEDPGWLQKYNDEWFAMLNALHMKNIATGLDDCRSSVETIDLFSNEGNLVSHLVAVLHPLLEHFQFLCKQSIERAVDLHRACTHMGYIITRAYSQLSSQGFCSPKEKSEETSGETGELESGTGLGDGDGAEDISKDIQPDEDLSELAQEPNKDESGEIEDEKDAVDMADEDMEGEMGSVDGADDEDDEKDGKEEEEEENEMDEEAGDVDDLDPTAVDEKMWDGDDDKADKDQKGDKTDGQQDDDQVAPHEDEAKNEDKKKDEVQDSTQNPEEGEGEEEDEEDEDVLAQEELNRQDQTVEEKDNLELPEDMELDLEDQEDASSESGDDLDGMSDTQLEDHDDKIEEDDTHIDEEAGKPENVDEKEDEAAEDEKMEEDEKGEGQKDEVDSNPADDETEDAKEDEEKAKEEDAPKPQDDKTADLDNAAPSDVKSSGQDDNTDSMELDEKFQANAAEQNEGDIGDGAVDEETSSGNKGAASQSEPQNQQDNQEKDDNDSSAAQQDPFKRLGNALEKWHRQQKDIQAANQDEEMKHQPQQDADEQAQKEFQHLKDDEDAPDTQAMGTADNEEVQPMDDAMAIDEEKQDPSSRVLDGDEDDGDEQADDIEADEQPDTEKTDREEDNNRTGVKTRQGNYNHDPTPEADEVKMEEDEDQSLQDASEQLLTTHLSDEKRLRDFGECLDEWSEYQTRSHRHSLSLTSQLRLILTPSQSTKLSGAFRTGKRLNIKRIIPYIASSYKRDKIWMRRALPTKRTYQILLCVDDSKSMGESSSGTLAMESLVMVSRSLTMLEAGQVGVLGFGAGVFDAHQLTEPFSADSGAKVLQRFTFSQDRTDIIQLIRQTIDTFRVARQQSSGGSDLWQLALILSDGLTPSSAHDGIRRLLREAMEERIMIVFIIMDDRGKKQGDSVLELKEAKFVSENGESKVVIERYLDTFPFQYYLIVHNLEELPSALAGLLRTWFAEVNS